MPKGKKKQPEVRNIFDSSVVCHQRTFYKTGGVKYDSSSMVECPKCGKMVNVGTGGLANLPNHDLACKGRPKGITQKISDMFKPKERAPLVPSTVSSAPLIIRFSLAKFVPRLQWS
jgi:ribosomal protein S27E